MRSLQHISFSSLCVTDDPFNWACDLEDIGFGGWEVVYEGKQALDSNLVRMREVCETTDLAITIHLPFSDLNLASLNYPIWDEVLRQLTSCIRVASEFADLMVVHLRLCWRPRRQTRCREHAEDGVNLRKRTG